MKTHSKPPHKFILESFQYSLPGRLGHGLVHNLNGPLQILSMQMEMLKMDFMKLGSQIGKTETGSMDVDICREFMDKAGGRVEQAAEVITRLETMIQVIGCRGEDRETEEQARPVDMVAFLNTLMEFWKADLYFKHRVEKRISMPEISVFVMMEETPVLAMLDGVMSAFLYCIKAGDREGSSFGLSLASQEEGGCRIEVEHTGSPIPKEICEKVMATMDEYARDRTVPFLTWDDMNDAPPDLLVSLLLGAVSSVDAGWTFDLGPNSAVMTVSH